MSAAVVDLQFEGVESLLEREYRNAPSYQWARELYKNGEEAGATRIHFGVEWQGVEVAGVHRRVYVDNGHGMTADEMRRYMRTLGKGGKNVGGAHDNYAMGCRLTLLPWNRQGVVVISLRDGETNMVKMMFDEEIGKYVLDQVQWVDETGSVRLSEVYPPYEDDDLAVDWAEVLPDWVREAGHGTAFVLLGNRLDQHTIDGDPERRESHRDMGRVYMNTRFWETDINVSYTEYRSTKVASWPQSRADYDRYQNRTIYGAKHFYEDYEMEGVGSILEAKGSVDFGGTRAYWFLRKQRSGITDPTTGKERPITTGGMATGAGLIALRYRNELYDHVTTGAGRTVGSSHYGTSMYQAFGISGKSVRERLSIIIEPPEFDETTNTRGVAPSTGRADLYWIGGGEGAKAASVRDFANVFAENMPDEIVEALVKEHTSKDSDKERRARMKRVMDSLSDRWRESRLLPSSKGDKKSSDPDGTMWDERQPTEVPAPRKATRRIKKVRIAGQPAAPEGESRKAQEADSTKGYPDVEWTTQEDIQDEYSAAAWIEPNKAHPNGLIQLDAEHPVFTSQVEYWQSQYSSPAQVIQVEGFVREVYEDAIISKVAHTLKRRGADLPDEAVRHMLSGPALTLALHGFLLEDSVIATRLGKLGRKTPARRTE